MTHPLIEPAAAECGLFAHPRAGVLADPARRGVSVLDVVIPVYNEQDELQRNR